LEILHVLGYIGAFVVGLVLGMIGSGGSILSMPILVYLFKLNAVTASAYSLFIVGVTALTGSFQNFKKKLINYRTTILFSISAVLSVYITRKYLIGLIPEVILSSNFIIIKKDQLIMIVFGILMLVAGYLMIKRTPKTIIKFKKTKTIAPNKLLIFLEGSIVGFLTGLIGAGGGFIIIPILVILSDLKMKNAVATSLLIVSTKSLIGFIGDIQNLIIDWNFLLIFTTISVFGIIIGQIISKKMKGNHLKEIFGSLVLIIGLLVLLIEVI
tara:strand:+ start:3945 stop:4751 length:807 start_codon:yes stop_codon:yes gene_type:complete